MKAAAGTTPSPSAPALHAALLDYFSAPGKHQLGRREPALLFASIREILQIAAGRGVVEGAAADKPSIREAAAFFLRAGLLYPGADHYAVLGLPAKIDPVELKERYRLLMRLIHPDFATRGAPAWPADAAVRVNRAYEILSSEVLRRNYDEQLSALATQRPTAPGTGDVRRSTATVQASQRRRLRVNRRAAWAFAGGIGMLTVWMLAPRTEPDSLVQKTARPVAVPQQPPAALAAQPAAASPVAMAIAQLPAPGLTERPPAPAAPAAKATVPPLQLPAAAAPPPSNAMPEPARAAPEPAAPSPTRAAAPGMGLGPNPSSPSSSQVQATPTWAAVPAPARTPPPKVLAAPIAPPAAALRPSAPAAVAAPAASDARPPATPSPAVAEAAKPHPVAGPPPVAVAAPEPASAPVARIATVAAVVSSPTLADAQPLLTQLLQMLETGSGEQLLRLLDGEARTAAPAQALSRQYDQLVRGERPVRLTHVEFMGEPRDGVLLVTGRIRMHAGEPTIGSHGERILVRAEFVSRGGRTVLKGLSGATD